jgi:predicted GNAT family acetyltransferase
LGCTACHSWPILLFKNKKSICLLVNERNTGAHNFYRKAGYEFRGIYDTIFLDAAC